MEKPTAALEISSAEIKLVVGYELDGQPIVLYAMRKPIEGFVERGQIIDVTGLSALIKGLTEIKDPTAKLKLSISEVTLIVPPLGLEVYQNDKTTNVVSPSGLVERIDISNVVSLVRKEVVPHGGEIVDIIPDAFQLDGGRAFVNPPIGEKSNSLSIIAKAHALPKGIIDDYRRAITQAGIRIKRTLIAPHAASFLFGCYSELPTSYIYVDMGAEVTTVNLIGNKTLFASLYFEKGGSDLTKLIMQSFNLPFDESEKIKRRFGIDRRSLSFHPVIAKSVDLSGGETSFTTEDLSKIIESFVDDYLSSLKNSIATLMAGYDKKYWRIPLIVSGGFSRLNGIAEILAASFPDNVITIALPKSIGARHQTYVNALGAVLANDKYHGFLDEERPVVTTLTRESKEAKERK